MNRYLLSCMTALAACGPINGACADDISANVSLENRYFFQSPLNANGRQHDNYVSIAFELEYFSALNDHSSLLIKPFVRADQYDSERSHADLRELVWNRVFDGWEVKAGISKVFWGVTESQHLVDVINQTDAVENIDGEDKLGQPMIVASVERSWGLIDVFILPYFRERTFAGPEGRPLVPALTDADAATYESADKQRHIDYAGRLLNFLGDLELGLSYFSGTSREPDFIPSGDAALTPYYRQMQQFGVDAQLTTEEWLWKLEMIKRNWSTTDFLATTIGTEYSIIGINDTAADLGIVVEYLYDDRGDNASTLFQNDLMTGLRITLNDVMSSEALIGVISDLDNQDLIFNIEASRRLGDRWTMELELRVFQSDRNSSPSYTLRRDDFLQAQVSYYF